MLAVLLFCYFYYMEKRKLGKSKIEGYSADIKKSGKFSVIIKVNKADYVPEPVTLRSKINPFLFTADATSEAIAKLEKDKAVLSVSISDKLPMVD